MINWSHFYSIFQLLLRRKAAEEVKRQQELKEKERNRVIQERTGELQPIADIHDEGN